MTNDYFGELTNAMTWVSEQNKTMFIGQSVSYEGHALYKSLMNVPQAKRLETPVFEDFQMGLCIGLALEGWLPISIFPRSDFLILASNQLANHLSNVRLISDNKRKVRVLIRVSVGSTSPMHPGLQHCQDYTEAIKIMCKNEIDVVELKDKHDILPAYQKAVLREDVRSTILVEYMDLYHTQGE